MAPIALGVHTVERQQQIARATASPAGMMRLAHRPAAQASGARILHKQLLEQLARTVVAAGVVQELRLLEQS